MPVVGDLGSITAGEIYSQSKKAGGAAKKPAAEEVKHQPAANLQGVFSEFTQGAKEMDGKTFAKMAVDCKIVGKACSKTDIDLIFAKVKDKTARKITYPQFAAAIEHCATKRGESTADLEAKVLASGGKTLTGTQPYVCIFLFERKPR